MRRIVAPLIAVIVTSCMSADSASPPTYPPAVPPSPSPAVDVLVLNVDTAGAVAGTRIRVRIQAFDAESRRIDTRAAVVTSSNPSVGALGNREFVNSYSTGAILELFQDLDLLAAGETMLRATLRERTESTTVHVHVRPPSTAALVVDSFTVVEWAATPFLLYSPLLRLWEPTGSSFVDVVAVEFSVGNKSTEWCDPGSMRYANGLSEHIAAIDPYPWFNDLMVGSPNGALPGPGRVRVIVRDAKGNFAILEAVAPVQRGVVTVPRFSVPWSSGWECHVTPNFP